MKRKRLPTVAALRRRLDAAFSVYVRRREIDELGFGHCVTCGARVFWNKANAGHFIARYYLATRYDERNAHFQCVTCNLYRHGNLIEYNAFMLRRYGQEVIDELRRLRRTTVKLLRTDYEELLAKFQTKKTPAAR